MDELFEDLKRLIEQYGEALYEVAVKLDEIYVEAYDNVNTNEFWDLVNEHDLSVEEDYSLRPLLHFNDGRTLRVHAWMSVFTNVYAGDTPFNGYELYVEPPTNALECASCGNYFTELNKEAVAFLSTNNFRIHRVCTTCYTNHTSWESCSVADNMSLFDAIPSHLRDHTANNSARIPIRTFNSMSYGMVTRSANLSSTSWEFVSAEDTIVIQPVTQMVEAYASSSRQSRIMNYTASPLNEYGNVFIVADGEKKPKNGRYYGIELEVETLSSRSLSKSVEVIADYIHPFGILTSDASLRDGFEIKSLPATMKAHRQIWTGFFERKPGQFVSSWKSGRCGMHVHVSAASISPMTLGKLNMFMNNTTYSPFISMVAGRNIMESAYCRPNRYASSVLSAFTSSRVARQYRKQYQRYYEGRMHGVEHNHHNAFVGNEQGKPTYEFRIFRGNLASAGFFKNLEFVDALITWCEETPPRNIRPENFSEWLILPSHASQYRHLLAYLKEKDVYKEVRGLTVYHDEEKELRVS